VLAALAVRAARRVRVSPSDPCVAGLVAASPLSRTAVFAFDPFGGYFPGPIYDEALRPPATLLVFRLVNLVWIGDRRGDRAGRRGARLESAPLARGGARRGRRCCASIVLTRWAGVPVSAITRADLRRVLDRTLTTDHFVVHYAPGTKTRADWR
jgi:hypothetical protein